MTVNQIDPNFRTFRTALNNMTQVGLLIPWFLDLVQMRFVRHLTSAIRCYAIRLFIVTHVGDCF